MKRNFAALRGQEFDVLVIGGGINGVAVARDAALRGLKVALVEKGDFGAGASAGCFKIVHSGVRYLQHLDFLRLRESVVEQKILRRIAGPYVHPLPFLIPCYGWGMKGKPLLDVGMRLFELLSCPRNQGVDSYHYLPKHQLLSREQTLCIAPHLNPQGLQGGVVYYDCQMSNCERLTWTVARGAIEAGALLCNYAEVVSGRVLKDIDDEEIVHSVAVRDLVRGSTTEVKAKFIVNAAGPWIEKVLEIIAPAGETPRKVQRLYTKGFQFIVPQFIKGYGVAVESRSVDEATYISRGARSYFIFPWRGHSLVGTTDELVVTEPDSFAITPQEIEEFRREAATAYPDAILKSGPIKFAFGGYRPVDQHYKVEDFSELKAKQIATPSREDVIIYHGTQQYDGYRRKLKNVISAEGMKYTTFRWFAGKITDQVVKYGGFKCSRSKSAETCLPGASDDQNYHDLLRNTQQAYAGQCAPTMIDDVVREYGNLAAAVMAIAQERSSAADRMSSSSVLGAAVIYAAREEMAQSLSDVVFRRTGLGTLGYPGDEAIRQAGQIMAEELGWSEQRLKLEIDNVRYDFTKQGTSF